MACRILSFILADATAPFSSSRLLLLSVFLLRSTEQFAQISVKQDLATACLGSNDGNSFTACSNSVWPPVVQWQDRDGWLDDLMQDGEPVLLVGTPADSWLARTSNKWTPEYLQQKVPLFKNVYRQPRTAGAFLYHVIDPDTGVVRREWLHTRHEKINMSAESFFALQGTNSTNLHYLALNIMRDWPDMLVDLNLTAFRSFPEDIVEPNIWVAGPDVVAQAHYDASHNIYVQLHGRKTFNLLPPSSVDACYLHSRYHPSFRQCQVSFTTSTDSKAHCIAAGKYSVRNESCNPAQFDRLETVLKLQQLRRVTLSEGDVFYLPPGWFHEVVSETISVSIALWGQKLAAWLDTQWEAEEAVTPFEEDWNAAMRCVWVSRFMLVVLEKSFALRVGGDSHKMAMERLHTLLDTRYVTGDPSRGSWKKAWSRLKETGKPAVKHLQAMLPCSNLQQSLTTSDMGQKIIRYAEPVAAIYAKLPEGMFQWSLDDYVELLSKFAVGAKNIPLMIAAILDQCG